MTENMKNIILRHRKILLSEDVKKRCNLSEHEIISAATLPELDEAYTRKVHEFNSISELYKWSSSVNYLETIEVPMILINDNVDPIVPDVVLETVSKLVMEKENVLHIEITHGGHLGFYEGGLLHRALVALIGSLTLNYAETALKGRNTFEI